MVCPALAVLATCPRSAIALHLRDGLLPDVLKGQAFLSWIGKLGSEAPRVRNGSFTFDCDIRVLWVLFGVNWTRLCGSWCLSRRPVDAQPHLDM